MTPERKAEIAAFDRGHKEGLAQGRTLGFKQGQDAAFKEVLQALRAKGLDFKTESPKEKK